MSSYYPAHGSLATASVVPVAEKYATRVFISFLLFWPQAVSVMSMAAHAKRIRFIGLRCYCNMLSAGLDVGQDQIGKFFLTMVICFDGQVVIACVIAAYSGETLDVVFARLVDFLDD